MSIVDESGAQHTLTTRLQVFAVELVGVDVSPQFINPATLLHNAVVDGDWVCNKGAQIGITESNFAYANGLEIEARDDSISFRHAGQEVIEGRPLSAVIARRYVEVFGVDNWFMVVLEFGGILDVNGGLSSSETLLWPAFAKQLGQEGVERSFRIGTIHHYPGRRLRVDLFQHRHPWGMPIPFTAGVHYDMSSNGDEETSHDLASVLSGWEAAWRDVAGTVIRLAEATLHTGGS